MCIIVIIRVLILKSLEFSCTDTQSLMAFLHWSQCLWEFSEFSLKSVGFD